MSALFNPTSRRQSGRILKAPIMGFSEAFDSALDVAEHIDIRTAEDNNHGGGWGDGVNGVTGVGCSRFPVFIPPSSKDVPSSLTLTVPKTLFFVVDNSKLSATAKDQAFWFLHTLLSKWRKGQKEPVPLHSLILDYVMRYKSHIFKLLIPKYIIQSKSYSVGSQSKTYSFDPTLDLSKTKDVEVTNQSLIRKHICSYEQRNIKQLSTHDRREVYSKLYEDLKQVSAPLKAIGVMVVEIEIRIAMGKDPSTLERSLLELMDGKMRWKLSHSGRLYTSLCQLPEVVRTELLLDGLPLVEIDLSNSHPALLTKFTDGEEREQLIELVSTGSFYKTYEYLWESDRVAVENEGKAGCHSFKQLIQKIVNGAPRPDLKTYQALYDDFPKLMGSIAAYKKKGGMDGFSNKLQGFEAELIGNVVSRLTNDIPCFTVYDGVAVPVVFQERVELLFAEETQAFLGFELPTKVKLLPLLFRRHDSPVVLC